MLRLFILFLAVLGLSSCKDLNQLVSFNLETNDRVFLIGAPDSVLTDTIAGNERLSMISDAFLFSGSKKFATNKTLPSKVEDVEAYRFDVVLASDSVKDFTFGRDYKFTLTSGNQYYDLGSLDFPEPGIRTLNFELMITESEWLNIIRRDEYMFNTEFTLNAPMRDTVKLDYRLSFRIKSMPVE